MEHWGLSGFPLSVGIGDGRVLSEGSGQVPVEQVGEVEERLHVDLLVVHHDGTSGLQTSAESLHDEEDDPSVTKPHSDVEVLDGQFSDEEETENATHLSSAGIVGPVEV